MVSLVNNYFKERVAEGTIDLDTDTLKILLVDTTTTADTEANIQTLSGYGTLGEFDGANYEVKTISVTSSAVDTGNDRYELDGSDVTYTALGVGTNNVQGVLLYKHVDGTDANDQPIAFIEFSSNLTPDGSDVTIAWDSEGILHLT
jgi:hypothetical protein